MSYLNNKYINKVEPHKLISEEDDDFVIYFNQLNIFTKIPLDPYFMFVYRLLGLGLINLI